MRKNVKGILYVLLAAGALFFGSRFHAGLNKAGSAPAPVDAGTNQPSATAIEPVHPAPVRHAGDLIAYGGLALLGLLGLSILAARDISHFLAHRVEQFVFDEGLAGERDSEYEAAEKVYQSGNYLEAVQLMRDYLREHPREQYVALRIAEIYEKDLGNFLAAALEYEEIIKKNLPAERWGWAAIHLANLYSGKLNKPAEATTLLRRITAEHPGIAAAKKARERLGEPEPSAEPEPAPASPEETPKAAPSNLPPGFRPK